MDSVTFSELIARNKKRRKKPSDEEHRLQCSCVRWFHLQHKSLRDRLIAVPNGGKRDPATAQKLLEEGVVAGVSDLILFVPNKTYGALFIEMKTPKGTQSIDQKRWESSLCDKGEYKYIICRSVEEFRTEVNNYLNNVT